MTTAQAKLKAENMALEISKYMTAADLKQQDMLADLIAEEFVGQDYDLGEAYKQAWAKSENHCEV